MLLTVSVRRYPSHVGRLSQGSWKNGLVAHMTKYVSPIRSQATDIGPGRQQPCALHWSNLVDAHRGATPPQAPAFCPSVQ